MEDVQAAQLRPGMYVGDTRDGSGLHNMVCAALDNAVAEVLCGGASWVTLDLYLDGSCAVTDDGPGMPIADPEAGTRSFPELLLTQHCFGIKHAVRTERPETIENVGLVPVNALSSWLELRTVKDSVEYLVRFEFGKLERPLAAVSPSERQLPIRGTAISFLPNASIFTPSAFDVDTIARTLGLITATTGVVVTLTDHRTSGATR
jgi:topoisomerase-4 subunit B